MPIAEPESCSFRASATSVQGPATLPDADLNTPPRTLKPSSGLGARILLTDCTTAYRPAAGDDGGQAAREDPPAGARVRPHRVAEAGMVVLVPRRGRAQGSARRPP